jgi:hypothetical protein
VEPLNDDELNGYLKQWVAPPAPAGMKAPRVRRGPDWRWMISGTIQVPVPAGLLAILILAFSIYWALSARAAPDRPQRAVTLSDFEPVKQLQPRIIRSGYEGK